MKMNGTQPPQNAKAHDKAAEHGKHGVAGHHVREKTNGEADRTVK